MATPSYTTGGGGGGSNITPKKKNKDDEIDLLPSLFPDVPTATPGPVDPNAVGTVGTNPLSGFAANYDPAQLSAQIWQNPWNILPDVFKGINVSGPGYQALRDLGADPVALYNIMQGGSSDLTAAGVGGYTNWLASLYKNLGTPGGRTFSSKEMLSNIFKQKSQGKGSENALARLLSSGGASEQIRTLFGLVQDAANAGMNPLASRGYIDAIRRAGDVYGNEMLRQPVNAGANNQMISEWMRTRFPGLVPR